MDKNQAYKLVALSQLREIYHNDYYQIRELSMQNLLFNQYHDTFRNLYLIVRILKLCVLNNIRLRKPHLILEYAYTLHYNMHEYNNFLFKPYNPDLLFQFQSLKSGKKFILEQPPFIRYLIQVYTNKIIDGTIGFEKFMGLMNNTAHLMTLYSQASTNFLHGFGTYTLNHQSLIGKKINYKN